MIREFSFGDFKSCRSVALPLAPLTVLIGANASGKSNVLEGIRLLSWLAGGRNLDEILHAVQEADQLVRGAVTDICRFGTSEFVLGCRLDDGHSLRLVLRPSESDLRVVSESLGKPSDTVSLYSIKTPSSGYSNEIQVEYNNFARGGKKPCIACTDQQAVFTQLLTPARFAAHHKESQRLIPATTANLRKALTEILFLDPVPRLMRDYSYANEIRLKEDGSNVSSVLRHVIFRDGDVPDAEAKRQVLAFVRSLPEQSIADLAFTETPRKQVMVRLIETFGETDHGTDAPLLSDGTLRVLAIAAALLSAKEGSLVIVEEIDNGVHPSRACELVTNILQTAKARNIRVLLTTHNPALLDALPAESIPSVVACYRDPKEGNTRLIALEKVARYPDLVAQGPVGRLMTAGVLDRFLKCGETAEQRKESSLAWLASLESGEAN